jgi:large subunit ribosomal protein L7/L12
VYNTCIPTGLYAWPYAKINGEYLLVSWPGPLIADTIPMPKLDDQISTLQEKLTQLKLRQQRLDARKRAVEALRERKATTRRKILVGGIVLAKVQQGEIDNEQFRGWLDQALTRADDRALFGLPVRDPG